MAREKPVELAGVSDRAWEELRAQVNANIFSCPFSYGTTFFFVIFWTVLVATTVILVFEYIGPSEYFWNAFWKCQSKHHMYHEEYTLEFCQQYSGWGSACMLSFFTIFSAGVFAYSYRESRKIKRWGREVAPVIESICKEHSPLFERYGYHLEMRGWKIIFRHISTSTDLDGISWAGSASPIEEGTAIPAVISIPSRDISTQTEEIV